MTHPSPTEILDTLYSTVVSSEAERRAQIDRLTEVNRIAVTAICDAARGGNVRCIAAVLEIQQLKK